MHTTPADSPLDENLPFVLVLRRLYERKLQITGIMLGVGILAALASLLIHNRYTSTTALMVQAPSVKVTGETPPLDIEVLREIVESDQVQYGLYTTMTLQGVVPKNESFRSFKENLKVSVRRKQEREQSLLPVVLLSVETKDPKVSKRIADAWKGLTEDRVSRMYESDRDSLSQFVDTVSKKADTELLQSEKAYTLAVVRDQLPIKRHWMKTVRSQYNSLFQEWSELELNIRVQENLLQYYDERIKRHTAEGVWIGDYAMRRFWEDEKLTALPETTSESQPTVASAYALVRSQRALAEFEMQKQMAFKKLELDSSSENMKAAQITLMASQDEMANAKTQYESLVAATKDESPKIVLNKAITDDALWDAYVQGKGTTEAAKIREPLKTEISNPVYETIHGQILQLDAKSKGLQGRILYYEEKVKTLNTRINELSKELSLLEGIKKGHSEVIAKEQEVFDFYHKRYNEMRQKSEETRQKLVQEKMEAKLKQQEANLRLNGNSRKTIELQNADGMSTTASLVGLRTLEKEIFLAETSHTVLGRDVKSRKVIRESLVQKAGEVMLLKAVQENESRSGLAVLFEAEENPVKSSPKRGQIVLLAMILTGMFLCAATAAQTLFVESGSRDSGK
ncbi:MAG TPA: hypothetical protein PLA90_03700 [Candidatus Sumerlaeota bacterium]|nr:hypothetical protein [Candidatus Sumerlaeota bacterium]HPS00623.1 hypothetical protein [Candidatus Sumerlaeota bacterium]